VSIEGIGCGTCQGRIRAFSYDAEMSLDEYATLSTEQKLIFSRKNAKANLMNPSPSKRLLYSSWRVSASKLLILIASINQLKKDGLDPMFNIAGYNTVISVASGASSSNEVGHNCFTWRSVSSCS